MKNDTTHSIRQSAQRFFSGTLLSRISGMLRDISMAYTFGTQPAIAAFMVAFRFAHLLRRLLGEGALQAAFIPEFEALRQEDPSRAFAFFRYLTWVLSLFLIGLICLGEGVLFAFLHWGNLTSSNQEIVSLTLYLLPSLLFICLFGLNASLLQCEKSYFIPSIAPVAFNGIWIAALFFLEDLPAEQAMQWLACGVILACFCQWLMTVPQTWTTLKKYVCLPSKDSLTSAAKDLRRLAKPLGLGILGVAASQINSAIDPLFARYADAEGPALLWYAIRLQQLPLALFGIAIAGAVLPPLSRALKAQRWDDYQHFLHYALSRTWALMLPLTAALFVMGDAAVQLIYGRGDFGPESVIGTTYCLWAYGVGLLPMALVLILAPAHYAQSSYSITTSASFAALFINVFFNSLFVFGFGWGYTSVALATSLSAWLNVCVLSWYLRKKGTSLLSPSILESGLIVAIASLMAFLGTWGVREWIQNLPFLSKNLLTINSFAQQLFLLGMQFLTFIAIFSFMIALCWRLSKIKKSIVPLQ